MLDPALTVSLPPALTAACGLDAFIHAFEAATNRKTHRGAQLYAHAAIRLISGALARAVAEPGDIEARGDLLLGSCYAGIAIDQCGTAVAHMISHALASIAPVNHGFATALAFEATLPWLAEQGTHDMQTAAEAAGLVSVAYLPGFVSALMDQCGFQRVLPAAFAGVTAEQLAGAMRAPGQAPMRAATVREIGDSDIEAFAALLLATAPGKAA
ncbi:MAG: iron-containing alcohol dehydrogenase [Methylobacterium sp.]|nr:MAG: iron-containing alcohol dehydrogenase [Methylobacterium sp.]